MTSREIHTDSLICHLDLFDANERTELELAAFVAGPPGMGSSASQESSISPSKISTAPSIGSPYPEVLSLNVLMLLGTFAHFLSECNISTGDGLAGRSSCCT
jgi:hypothetical protein